MKINKILLIIISTFSIFMLLTVPITSTCQATNSILPSWVKVGAYAGYFVDIDKLVLKYNKKFYSLTSIENSTGYMFWKIIKINGDILTIQMNISLNNMLPINVPSSIYQKIHLYPLSWKGHLNYKDKRIFKVNFLKRELLSNGGYVNLWINPATDVTWIKKNVTSVQENPHAKLIAKYMDTKYIPKVMVFPTKLINKKLGLYDPYVMTTQVSQIDMKILQNKSSLMILPNTSYSPFFGMPAYYDRDTGIFLMGNYLDDVLFTVFHNYGGFLCAINMNDTNIIKSKVYQNQSSSFPWMYIVIPIVAIVTGVAVWILWKQKK